MGLLEINLFNFFCPLRPRMCRNTFFRQAEFARHAISQKINLPVEKKTRASGHREEFCIVCTNTRKEPEAIRARALFLPLTHMQRHFPHFKACRVFKTYAAVLLCVSTDKFYLQ